MRSEVEHLEQCIVRFASCPRVGVADPDEPRWKAKNSFHQKKKIVERKFLAVVDYALGVNGSIMLRLLASKVITQMG